METRIIRLNRRRGARGVENLHPVGSPREYIDGEFLILCFRLCVRVNHRPDVVEDVFDFTSRSEEKQSGVPKEQERFQCPTPSRDG